MLIQGAPESAPAPASSEPQPDPASEPETGNAHPALGKQSVLCVQIVYLLYLLSINRSMLNANALPGMFRVLWVQRVKC